MPACARCNEKAVRFQGRQHLCARHYRFGQMRASAKRHGKVVPSHAALEAMVPVGMVCPDCDRKMVWFSSQDRELVASLQHYRDGQMALVCRSCNTRHAYMPDDLYRETGPGFKWCPGCEKPLPLSAFWLDSGRTGSMKNKSRCRDCGKAEITKWRTENRERYNEYQRQYRARRKAAGNPVASGT